MGMDGEKQWLTKKQAAKRVGMSLRTIHNWRLEGMPMPLQMVEGQRMRVVDEDVLLAFWRDRMQTTAWHFYRVRKRLADAGVALETPEVVKAKRVRASEVRQGVQVPGRPDSAGDGRTEPETPISEPKVDPLAEMPRLKGSDEFFVLRERLRETVPACAGMPEYTADHLSPDDRERLTGICAGCTLLEQCRTFALASNPAGGFWPTTV